MKRKEIWKPIKGFENYYIISSLGCVKSVERKVKWKEVKVLIKSRIISQQDHYKGYKLVCLWKNGRPKMMTVHRLVALAFKRNPLNKKEVNHKDGNKKNNCASNLEWVTTKENAMHAHKMGLRKYN